MIIGLCVFFLGSVLAANTSNIVVLVIGRALQGGGAISAVLMAFLADSVSENNRAKANALVGFQIGVAFMLSLLIGPIISSKVGLQGLFWSIAFLSIVAMILVLSLKHSPPVVYYKLSYKAFKEILTKELIAIDLSVFSLHLILAAGFIVMPILIVENQIVSMSDNWHLYLPAILLSFLGMLPLIVISEKFQKTKYILMLSILLLIVSQLLFLNTNYNFSLFLATLTIFFIAFNSIEALLPSLLSRKASSEKRGLAMGIFSTSQFLGTFFGGAIGGLIYDIYNLNSVFLFTIFVAIIWWFLILFLPLKTKTLQE